MEREIPQELRRYVEEEILPQYAQSDPAHGLGHIQAVVENSLELLDLVPADPRLVYVIAAYHDLGAARFGREDHEKTSARLLRQDRALERWFTPEERELMAQAVEDHRPPAAGSPGASTGRSSARRTGTSTRSASCSGPWPTASTAAPSWGRRARCGGRWNTSGRSTGRGAT